MFEIGEITQYDDLVNRRVRRYSRAVRRNPRLDRKDLQQVGYMAVIEASRIYTEEMGCTFECYAVRVIDNALYHEYVEKGGLTHIPASTYSYRTKKGKGQERKPRYSYVNMDAGTTDVLYVGNAPEERRHVDWIEAEMAESGMAAMSAEDEAIGIIQAPQRRKAAEGVRELLTGRQMDMLERHYIHGENYSQIGDAYGVTRQTVRSVCNRAENRVRSCGKLREECQSTGLIG